MAKVITASRHSISAERSRPASESPFRSSLPRKRVLAAEEMVEKRRAEIEALESLLRQTADDVEERRVVTRLTATLNNLASWEAYLNDGAPKETRAVIIP